MSLFSGRRVAYVTPFSLRTNLYIEMQKELARQSGYEIRPFSMKHLFLQGGLLGLMQRQNLVLVQWLETRPFKLHGTRCQLSAAGLMLFFTSLLLLAVCPATVAFFVHDHAVNDTEGVLKALSQWFMFTLRRVADYRVVHDPGCQKMYDATYLPHPLYWDRPGSEPSDRAPPVARVAHTDGAPLRCAMLGAIRVYKSIDSVLRVWPASQPLVIAGRSTHELTAVLEAIVKQRSLGQVVSIDPTHQSNEAFDKHLSATDVLILPHASETALVSGAFFETIGRVPFIVARRSRFMEWAASEFDGVHVFDRPEELPALLQLLDRHRVEVSAETVARARAAFGRDRCSQQWGALFQSIARTRLGQGRRPSALRR